jgi:3-deoxy-manno-octulosonate cytidylyltransferase (CMP-KDO synthetase)
MNKFTAIIPARYASTRFPGKPLAQIAGKPVIQHVYEQVSRSIDNTIVATDDERILLAVRSFGGRAVMTSNAHRSGTDRCHEAAVKTGSAGDIIINVQGDEPFIEPEQIELLKTCFDNPGTQIATLVKPFPPDVDQATLSNPNTPKVVLSSDGNALYFSRSVIPYHRDRHPGRPVPTYYKHIGIYAYRADILADIISLPRSPLEQAEELEQLRWLENGYRIRAAITCRETIGIDTPEDLERAIQFYNNR